MRVNTVAEDIMVKTAATKRGNLGDTNAKPRYDRAQGRDYERGSGRDLHLPAGNGTRWQKQERTKEIRTNATVASAGDIIDLQKCIGDYQNTTKFFTSKNKVWCAPIREHAEGLCGHCNKKHWLDTLCNGGDACKLVDASERHSLCPKEMASDMDNGAFKRLTFRFQGGSGGLPKAKTGAEAVAAVLQVTTALGGAKRTLSTAQQTRKAKAIEKRKTKKAAAKAAAAAETAAGTDEDADEDSQSEEAALPAPTRKVLTIGQRPARQSQLATREQRRGVARVLMITSTASGPTSKSALKRAQKKNREERRQRERNELRESMGRKRAQPAKPVTTSWGRMAALSQSLQRLQATMKGAVVRKQASASDSESRQKMTAMEAANLQSDMVAWRQRLQASQARTTLSATVTMALAIRKLRMASNTTNDSSVRTLQSIVKGTRVRKRMQAVQDWSDTVDSNAERDATRASQHWQQTVFRKTLSMMRPAKVVQNNLFANAVHAKHWRMTQLRNAWTKLTPVCVWRMMAWRALKKKNSAEQQDLTAVPTMQLITALNSACSQDTHESASTQLANELEDAGNLATRQAQHKRAAVHWTRQQLQTA
jgi:hypothetical protein